MAIRYSPKTATQDLVFAYDTGNRKSYKGEPTTNLISTALGTGGGATLGSDSEGDYIQLPSSISSYAYIKIPNVGVDAGSTYIWSFDLKCSTTMTEISFDTNEYSNEYSNSNDASRVSYQLDQSDYLTPGVWQTYYVKVTMKTGITGAYAYDFFRFFPAEAGKKVYIRNVQMEYKDHITQYTGLGGSRTNGDSLKSLVGDYTLTLGDVSFTQDAEIDFNGVDNHISVPNAGITDYSSSFSMECVYKVPAGATWSNGYRGNIYSIAGSYGGQYGLFRNTTNNTVGFQIRDASTGVYLVPSTTLPRDTWVHLVAVYRVASMELYINGEQAAADTCAFTGGPDSIQLHIGGQRAFGGNTGNHFSGSIAVAKYYKRDLSAEEVQQNFNAIKGRFGM